MNRFNFSKEDLEKGASALPVVLLISGIIMEVVVSGLIVAQLLSGSLLSEQLATEALNIARSGAQDGVNRVLSYMDCPNPVYCPAAYQVTIGSRYACVNISVSGDLITILSQSSVLTREKTVEVVLGVSEAEGRATVQSFKEIESPASPVSCS